jgi:hypothetical protein
MSPGNWWADKLGGAPARPAPTVNNPAPRIPTGGFQPPVPFGAQFAPQGNLPPAPEPVDPGPTINEHGEISVTENIGRWKGSREGLKETATCPSCGSIRYFSRQSAQTGKVSASGQTVYPAPECFECGYPREQGSLGAVAKVVGGGNASRQGAMPAFNGFAPAT